MPTKTLISRCAISLLALLAILSATWPGHAQSVYVNLLGSGNFESGFVRQNGCGDVGVGWQCFTNGGAAVYGFYDDQWPPVIAEGAHSQLIEINQKEIYPPDNDRYAGIQQTIRVAKGLEYTLGMQGMIRTTLLGPETDPGRYRVQVGWSFGMTRTWDAVTNWTDVGWNTFYDRLQPGRFSRFSTKITPTDDVMTLYVRVWKKWGATGEELDVNLDNISFVGPVPPAATPGPTPLSVAGYQRAYGESVSFAYPGSWTPARIPSGETPIFETWQLGIPDLQGEQLLLFSAVPFGEIRPTDIASTKEITIGGKAGTKWIRQGPNYMTYQYCTTGYADAGGSFCVRVTTPVHSPQLELQLDRLVSSITFY